MKPPAAMPPATPSAAMPREDGSASRQATDVPEAPPQRSAFNDFLHGSRPVERRRSAEAGGEGHPRDKHMAEATPPGSGDDVREPRELRQRGEALFRGASVVVGGAASGEATERFGADRAQDARTAEEAAEEGGVKKAAAEVRGTPRPPDLSAMPEPHPSAVITAAGAVAAGSMPRDPMQAPPHPRRQAAHGALALMPLTGGDAAEAEADATDAATLLHRALAPHARGGDEQGKTSFMHHSAAREPATKGKAWQSELPGWHALRAEVVEDVRQKHFAPAMPSLPLSFTGQFALAVADEAGLAAQVLDGLEPALASAPEWPAQRSPAMTHTVRTLEIRLHPEHLGAIAAQIERRGDALEITLRAARRDVADELEKTAHHLADRLQAAAGHATRVQLHIAVLPPGAAAEAQQPQAPPQQQGAAAFTQQHAGQGGQAAQQQPGGRDHAQRHDNAGVTNESGARADGGGTDSRGARGLYL